MLPVRVQLWAPSLLDFRLKPDWEGAAPLFERAALAYKVRGGSVIILFVTTADDALRTILVCVCAASRPTGEGTSCI